MTAKNKDDLTAKVLSLDGLVEYQPGSVVSRTIISGKAGTVTAFAFAEGQGLSEHTAPFDAMVEIVDGRAEVAIAGQPLVLGKGEIVIMPAGKPHALKALEPFKMLLVMIRS